MICFKDTTFCAAPKCQKCNDTGWYAYDHNHGKICEFCCPHDQGFWQLHEHYGEKNGKWCCKAGCGFVKDTRDEGGGVKGRLTRDNDA